MFADERIQFLRPSSLVIARAAFSMAASDMGALDTGVLDMVFFGAKTRTAGSAKLESFFSISGKDSACRVYSVQR